MRDFILTADDFGRSPAINAAICQWYRAGALHQASLMVNEPYAKEARIIAKENPGLRIGLHLTLCDGIASNGRPFIHSPLLAGLWYACTTRYRYRLRTEIQAQFESFLDMGFPPTYWDGHAHLHLHPAVFALALPIALKYGFRFMRLVREPGPVRPLPWIFSRLSQAATVALKKNNIGFSNATFGLRKSGEMDAEEFQRAFTTAPEGITEIYFHPGAETSLPEPEWVARQAHTYRIPVDHHIKLSGHH